MQEFGRFKRGKEIFYGQVKGNLVHEIKESCETGFTESWNELVILPPCEPSKIIFSRFQQKDFLLRAPSSLLPHRSMISLPFPEHETLCEVGVAWIIGKIARRIKAHEAMDYLWGFSSLQSVGDQTIAQHSITRAYSYDTFMPLGPTFRSEILDQGNLELWHNGELKQQADLKPILNYFPVWLAEVSDAMTLWPGDILALTFSDNAPTIKPGDHVEVNISSLRPLATNVGMRGSA